MVTPCGCFRWQCENNVTLGYLKKDLNFTGWVMSDWGGMY